MGDISMCAGANHDDARGYMPHITSYDYGAPIGESGLLTDKFRVRGWLCAVKMPYKPCTKLWQASYLLLRDRHRDATEKVGFMPMRP